MPGQSFQEHTTCPLGCTCMATIYRFQQWQYALEQRREIAEIALRQSVNEKPTVDSSERLRFIVNDERFCCNNPRIDLNGSTVLAKKSQLCGDILANFNENSQQIKFVRGPAANATQEQLDVLAAAGRGDMVPTAVGFKAVKKDEEWQRVTQAICRGDRATLITWTHDGKEDESQKAELCPTGTVPVQGRGYMSFACDGHVIKERRYHCCNVNGQLHCSPSLVDATSMDPPCDCHQNDVAAVKESNLAFLLPLLGHRRKRRAKAQEFL